MSLMLHPLTTSGLMIRILGQFSRILTGLRAHAAVAVPFKAEHDVQAIT
jgi:hypothetical protein